MNKQCKKTYSKDKKGGVFVSTKCEGKKRKVTYISKTGKTKDFGSK